LLVISYSILITAMQIEYSSNFVKALISTAAAPITYEREVVHLMQNLRLRGRLHQPFLHGYSR